MILFLGSESSRKSNTSRGTVFGVKVSRREATEREIKESRDPWMESWQPILTSDEVPINPYRVIWEMDQTIDHDTSIVTHDAVILGTR